MLLQRNVVSSDYFEMNILLHKINDFNCDFVVVLKGRWEVEEFTGWSDFQSI